MDYEIEGKELPWVKLDGRQVQPERVLYCHLYADDGLVHKYT